MVTSLLIVEPRRETRLELITAFGNSSHPFKVWSAICAQGALQILDHHAIDMVITELQLPDMSGFLFLDFIAQIQHVLVYSDGDEAIILRAFECRIDDFAVKSRSSIPELVLRTRAILRRSTQQYLQVGDIYVDIPAQRVWRKGVEIDLPNQCFKFFLALVRYPNQVISRNQLTQVVGSTPNTKGYRILYVLALKIRRKLELDPMKPQYIRNVRGIGYIFKTDSIS